MFFCFTIAMHSKIVSIARLVLIEGRNCWHYVWMSLMMVSFTLLVFIGEYDCWYFVWMYLMVVSFILHSKVDVFKLHVFIGGCASVRKTSYLRRRHKSASVVLATLMATLIVVVLSLPKQFTAWVLPKCLISWQQVHHHGSLMLMMMALTHLDSVD